MVGTTSTRILRKAVAPMVFVVVALGATAPIAEADDELALAITLILGISLLGAAGFVYSRVRTTNPTQPVATPPTVTYAAHRDMGIQAIEADAPLSSRASLCLVPGAKRVTATLATEELVAAHETKGVRDEPREHRYPDAR